MRHPLTGPIRIGNVMIDASTRPSDVFPYEIRRQVGSGSMGVVFEALDPALDRPVAIKTLRASMLREEDDETRLELRQRFLQEARAAAALSHPGATTIYQVGQLDDEPFIVMEWLAGRTLEQVLGERQRLRVEESLELAISVLDTLEAAHRAGIVHRDVKPSNLLVLDDGRLKVTDFGIASIEGRELVKTRAGVILATPRFAAPEQLRGINVDGRADLFSLGIVLYLMLTGEYPFAGETLMELATSILQREPRPPRQLRPDLPESLDALVLRTLAKNRELRPRSAARLAEELRRILEGTLQRGFESVDPTLPAAELELAGTDSVTESGVPVLRDLPQEAGDAARAVVETWEHEDLARQPIEPLLRRLLDRPLHTSPFAGALEVEGTTLLIADGRLVQAWSGDALSGDAAVARLAREGDPRLRRAPEAGWVAGLATLTLPPTYRHRDLDSSFVNLPALADRLRQERACGVICLEHVAGGTQATARAWILLCQGRTLAALYSRGWDELPVEQSWRRWVADHPVRASVLELKAPPLEAWYPHALAGLRLEIERPAGEHAPAAANGSGRRRLFSSSSLLSASALPAAVVRPASSLLGELPYESAPAFRILSWMLAELPAWLAERRLGARWKYLSEWIPLVRRARLHHDLRRPGSEEHDRFDVVTFDERGKVLHLVERVETIGPDSLRDFVGRVKVAKKARIGSGDVGAAILVAPSFCEKTLEVYESTLETASSGRWLSLGETLTGYGGFVRIGPRRGFHLLLVAESEDHVLEPVLALRARPELAAQLPKTPR
jgi:serine/threonine protein kinase